VTRRERFLGREEGGGGRGGGREECYMHKHVCNTYECTYIDSYIHRYINIYVYTYITHTTHTHTLLRGRVRRDKRDLL